MANIVIVTFKDPAYLELVIFDRGFNMNFGYLNPSVLNQSIRFEDPVSQHNILNSEEVILTMIAGFLAPKPQIIIEGDFHYLNPIVSETKLGLRKGDTIICTTVVSQQ